MKRIELPGCTVTQQGAALSVTVAGPVPVLLEFSGEALVALLTAAQAAFRERKKPKGCAEGGRRTAAGWRVA